MVAVTTTAIHTFARTFFFFASSKHSNSTYLRGLPHIPFHNLPNRLSFHTPKRHSPSSTPRPEMDPHRLVVVVVSFFFFFLPSSIAVEILSKSKLEKCVKVSESDSLLCDRKIVVNMAVPSGSGGGEASIVAELVEVEENSTQQMQTIRDPPVISIHKSSAYSLYEIMYIRDVAYKPHEFYVKTRKCEPDAGSKIVKVCERLRDQNGHVIEHTQPICCPCGPRRRIPSSCGNIFEKLLKGKANTAHCLRFPGDWFHVFAIGRRSLGFSVRIEVKKGPKMSEVTVGPENRTVLSDDKFLSVNLIGDFVGYTSLPSFEDFYLVIPRQGTFGPSQDLGKNFSKWMLLERVRFTLDGLECNKIGVSYQAYNGQPNFCSAPFWSCLHNQLWNFWEADQNRIRRNQSPQYVVEGRFQRINEHPNAGTHSFSIGITEVLNTNLLIELNADDIEYVYQKSPGKIIGITIPTFQALTQFGIATITAKNIGKLEASYSLTFECSSGVSHMEEQFFIMAPEEVASRSFKLYPTTDQAATHECTAVLKASDFSEVDKAECQFTTTSTILDNGSQIISPYPPTSGGINGFLESIESLWNSIWSGLSDFFTGKSCSCHVRYICLTWIVLFGLLLAIIPTAVVLLWLLHQKGFFDPLHDWWEDQFGLGTPATDIHPRHSSASSHIYAHEGVRHNVRKKNRHHGHDAAKMQIGHHTSDGHHKRRYSSSMEIDDNIRQTRNRSSAHVRKEKHKHRRSDESRLEHRHKSSLRELPLVIRDHEEKHYRHHKHKHPKL